MSEANLTRRYNVGTITVDTSGQPQYSIARTIPAIDANAALSWAKANSYPVPVIEGPLAKEKRK